MNPASLDCTHSCSREGRLGSERLACSHGAQLFCVGTAAHDLVLVWPACVLCAQSPPALALPLAICSCLTCHSALELQAHGLSQYAILCLNLKSKFQEHAILEENIYSMWLRTDTQTDKTFQCRPASVGLAQTRPNHPIQADMCLS